ncbi:hypothetical protein BJ878DRAFT_514680 [Calycina marina]|uniref:Uncharacterized protein n=1 Tax=Calycina marina TaxID=1763456 RepID=A0A9P7YZ30_9HELO|nr:hypothetical protein BJ878DRAFT_514680 [Calycina marina]
MAGNANDTAASPDDTTDFAITNKSNNDVQGSAHSIRVASNSTKVPKPRNNTASDTPDTTEIRTQVPLSAIQQELQIMARSTKLNLASATLHGASGPVNEPASGLPRCTPSSISTASVIRGQPAVQLSVSLSEGYARTRRARTASGPAPRNISRQSLSCRINSRSPATSMKRLRSTNGITNHVVSAHRNSGCRRSSACRATPAPQPASGDPPSVLDTISPVEEEHFIEARTTRVLNSLTVDARLALNRARSVAITSIIDPAIRARIDVQLQQERAILECLHHLRQAHLAAGIAMFDMFRNATSQIDELLEGTIDLSEAATS